jgi:hypothetical protein
MRANLGIVASARRAIQNVASFFTTVKGTGINEPDSGTTRNLSNIAVRGEFRYIYGKRGTSSSVVIGSTTYASATIGSGNKWIARIGDDGEAEWVTTFSGSATDFNSVINLAVADNGDLILAVYTGTASNLRNIDGTSFTPSDSITTSMVARISSDGTWLWARAFNGSSSVAPGYGMATAGSHLVLSLFQPGTLTYGGTAYTVGNRGVLLFVDADTGSFSGHVVATSTADGYGTRVTVNSSGTVRWLGVHSGSGTVTVTVHSTSVSVPQGGNWLFELTLSSATAGRTLPAGWGDSRAFMTDLPDGGLAIAVMLSGTATSDLGNSVTVARTGNVVAVAKFNSSLVAQSARKLHTDGRATVTLGGVSTDGDDLIVLYALSTGDTVAGTAITASSTATAAVVHRITTATLADVWAVWAASTPVLELWTNNAYSSYLYVDSGTAFVYLSTYPSSTGASTVLHPGTVTYARESLRYELLATVSASGTWGP